MDAKHILAVTLLALVLPSMAYSLLLTGDGGVSGFIIPDKPFHSYGCSSSILVNITYPENNETFYFPNITPNVTYTVVGALNPICYTATSGNYTLRECVNGVNWYLETLPQGYDVPLSVLVVDDCGSSGFDSITLNVHYNHGSTAVLDDEFMIWLFILVILMCLCYGIIVEYESLSGLK